MPRADHTLDFVYMYFDLRLRINGYIKSYFRFRQNYVWRNGIKVIPQSSTIYIFCILVRVSFFCWYVLRPIQGQNTHVEPSLSDEVSNILRRCWNPGLSVQMPRPLSPNTRPFSQNVLTTRPHLLVNSEKYMKLYSPKKNPIR